MEQDGSAYRDIEWLMPSLDLDVVLPRLGVEIVSRHGENVVAYCPDHYLFTHRQPSHPKWYLHVRTGKCICFTEGRGSNLVFVASRVLNKSLSETVEWLLDTDNSEEIRLLRIKSMRQKLHEWREGIDRSVRPKVKGLQAMQEDVRRGLILQSGLDYFMRPPGKKATNISQCTVQHFQVFQRTWGYYSNRVITPFFMRRLFVGFVANDILGEDEWLKRHPGKNSKSYRKVLYPSDFRMGEYLFGFDEAERYADPLLLVEGTRDAMKAWQEGFGAVALLHTDLTDDQLILLGHLTPKSIVVMFDGDIAGYDNAPKVAKKLEDFFSTRIAVLPIGFDPKNLNGNAMADLIKKSKHV